jgi:YesN/AraC family two-component response regulator
MKEVKYSDIRCLYVEDDVESRAQMQDILGRLFTDLYVAEDGEEGLELFEKVQPDLVISDIRMPGMSGLEMSSRMQKIKADICIVLTTAHNDTEYLMHSIELGILHYVIKPIDLAQLYRAIEKSTEIIRMRKSLAKEQQRKDELIKELQNALGEIKSLRSILPICSFCHNIRDDKGYWNEVDDYFHKHSGLDFSHSICPDCYKKHYPQYFEEEKK